MSDEHEEMSDKVKKLREDLRKLQEAVSARFSVRMTPDEAQRVEALQEQIQQRYARMKVGVKVTQKTVFLEALEALEERYRDNARKRKGE